MAYAISGIQMAGMYAIFWLILSLNIAVGMCSWLTHKILMRNVDRLVSLYPAQQSGDMSEDEVKRRMVRIAIELWRKNMTSFKEIRRLFSPTIFGMCPDSERMISMNALALALSMILWNADSFFELMHFSTLFCA